MTDSTRELLDLSRQLLRAIDAGDWSAYRELCDPSLTAFEPEAEGHLVEGLDFHHYYFGDQPSDSLRKQSSMSSPRVRLLGESGAVVTYVRLVQRDDEFGTPGVTATEETRIWEKQQGRWRHVHFHRSPCR